MYHEQQQQKYFSLTSTGGGNFKSIDDSKKRKSLPVNLQHTYYTVSTAFLQVTQMVSMQSMEEVKCTLNAMFKKYTKWKQNMIEKIH